MLHMTHNDVNGNNMPTFTLKCQVIFYQPVNFVDTKSVMKIQYVVERIIPFWFCNIAHNLHIH